MKIKNEFLLEAGHNLPFFKIFSVSHDLESSDVMTLQDSLYPLPPRENQDFRVVGSSELHLTVEYFDFVQVDEIDNVPEATTESFLLYDLMFLSLPIIN